MIRFVLLELLLLVARPFKRFVARAMEFKRMEWRHFVEIRESSNGRMASYSMYLKYMMHTEK